MTQTIMCFYNIFTIGGLLTRSKRLYFVRNSVLHANSGLIFLLQCMLKNDNEMLVDFLSGIHVFIYLFIYILYFQGERSNDHSLRSLVDSEHYFVSIFFLKLFPFSSVLLAFFQSFRLYPWFPFGPQFLPYLPLVTQSSYPTVHSKLPSSS